MLIDTGGDGATAVTAGPFTESKAAGSTPP